MHRGRAGGGGRHRSTGRPDQCYRRAFDGQVRRPRRSGGRPRLKVNVFGPLFLCQPALPHLIASHGNIVNVASRGSRAVPISRCIPPPRLHSLCSPERPVVRKCRHPVVLPGAAKNVPQNYPVLVPVGFSALPKRSERTRICAILDEKSRNVLICDTSWRSGRDSNPRYAFDVYSLSRRAPSTTRPPLRIALEVRLPIVQRAYRQGDALLSFSSALPMPT